MQEIVQKYYVETLPGLTILDLELACEDHGQAVVYRGTIPYHRHALQLDKHHWIETDKQFPMCGNIWRKLHDTRFLKHFDFYGNFDQHFGIFPGCGMEIPFNDTTTGEQKNGFC